MTSPGYERNASSKLRLSFRGNVSRRSENDSDSYKLVDVPFSSLQNESSDDEGYGHRPRGNQGSSNRQLYLRSYPFSRKRTLSDKVKIVIRKLKAAAWAVMACNYKPIDTRKWKDTFHRKVGKYVGTGHCMPPSSPGLRLHRRLRLAASS